MNVSTQRHIDNAIDELNSKAKSLSQDVISFYFKGELNQNISNNIKQCLNDITKKISDIGYFLYLQTITDTFKGKKDNLVKSFKIAIEDRRLSEDLLEYIANEYGYQISKESFENGNICYVLSAK